MIGTHAWSRIALVSAILGGAACGDRGGTPGGDTTQAPPAAGGAPEAPAAPPTGAGAIALGDSIFHGTAANGICFTCHGQDAKGTQLAPDLTDGEWLNADGSLQSIADVITKGVPQPKKFPGPMPPMGGALTPEQVNAVAQYVHSLSQKR